MPRQIHGNHHFTYGVGGAQEDYDFHTGTLGLRFLKKTALYEGNVPIYHLYYGNAHGDPGAVLTAFPMRQQGVVGQLGANQIARLNLSIPIDSVGFWADRLRSSGIEVEIVELYGTQRLHFSHPCGVPYGIVADGEGDPARSWEGHGVSADYAILGSHGLTVNVVQPDSMIQYLETGVAAERAGADTRTQRWRIGDSGRGRYVELVETPDEPPGTQQLSEGTVHHCAWDVGDERVQMELKGSLEELGYTDWFGPKDRTYFVSVYNRTPSGALFEYCWSKPESWTIDEAEDELGQTFLIPPMFADREQEFVEYLEPIETRHTCHREHEVTMPVEFGIFDHIEAREGVPIDQLYEGRIEMVKRAEAGGFYAFHLAEHHGHLLSTSPSQPVFLAALARETTTIKLIPTVVCLPLHHPVRIFEELAMLDVLSHGRLELGTGKGITPFEHLQFGHHPDEASERMAEILAMLLEAWQTGIISSEGSKYYDFLELKLPFEPIQKPYPPLWSAGNVERAGRGGHNFIFPMPISDDVRAQYDELRAESRKQENHQNPHVHEPWIGQAQTVVIADTDEQAEAIGRRAWAYYMQTVGRAHGLVPPHRQGSKIPEPDNPLAKMFMAMDPIESELVVAGTVDRIRDYYLRQVERGLANYFIVGTPAGDMTAEEVRRTLDAFAAEVIPAVRELEASAVAVST